jgi:hypothetical protein
MGWRYLLGCVEASAFSLRYLRVVLFFSPVASGRLLALVADRSQQIGMARSGKRVWASRSLVGGLSRRLPCQQL